MPANINQQLLTAAQVVAALGALVLVGSHFVRRRPRPPAAPPKRQPTAAPRGRPAAGNPWTRPAAPDRAELAALEAQLRTAIFNPGGREHLVADAMKKVGGDRAAAIRKVLDDLHRDNLR